MGRIKEAVQVAQDSLGITAFRQGVRESRERDGHSRPAEALVGSLFGFVATVEPHMFYMTNPQAEKPEGKHDTRNGILATYLDVGVDAGTVAALYSGDPKIAIGAVGVKLAYNAVAAIRHRRGETPPTQPTVSSSEQQTSPKVEEHQEHVLFQRLPQPSQT